MTYKQYFEKSLDIETRAAYDNFYIVIQKDKTLTQEQKFFLTRSAWQNYIDCKEN